MAKPFFDLNRFTRAFSKEAVMMCISVMRDEDQPAALRLKAAQYIMDRGYGKPRQEMVHQVNPQQLSDEQLESAVLDLLGLSREVEKNV